MKVHMMTGGTQLRAFVQLARDAVDAGFAGLVITESGRTAYLSAAVAAIEDLDLDLATGVAVAFPPVVIDSLASLLSRLGMRQLHVAETEKYAHVTYFFNGGVEATLPGEERILVPSRRDVPTYDLAPEMSAGPITDEVVSAIRSAGSRPPAIG